MSLTGQPIILLKEGTQRTKGKDALSNNIQAAKVISQAVRSSLGPKGMDKMLVDSFGDVIITNDGATILKEIDVQHPGAKFVVDLAKTQDEEVGDGTTSVVILAGELLKNAEALLDENIHPSMIVEGYRLAREEALKMIKDIAVDVKDDERDKLLKIAATSMYSKAIKSDSSVLSELVVDAILSIRQEHEGDVTADIKNVVKVKKLGDSLNKTQLIRGLVIDKEVVHNDMPTSISSPKILLINSGLELTKTEFDAKFTINTPEDVQRFMDREKQMLQEMAEKIINSGANVVFCQKGIDDKIQTMLAAKGIMAIRRVKKSDIKKLGETTGAKIVTNLDDIESDYIGTSKTVEQRNIAGDEMIFVTDTPQSKVVTLLIRGGTDFVLDEYERSIHDALCVVRNIVEDKNLVPGGGAIEFYLSKKLEAFADKQPPKIQRAVHAFAKSLQFMPQALAENAGLDPINILGELNQKFAEKQYNMGVSVTGVADMTEIGVMEPVRIKYQAISSAAEAASIILRIDDVVSAKNLGGGMEGGMPGGMPPGGMPPGGMPGGMDMGM